ncbi:SET domain-containing protein [Mycena vitilis]|nr:SET domain-containing protein [Mycena vitilis]
MKKVFECVIRQNTADDEPDAPEIELINDVDDEPTPPWNFYYTNKLWLGDEIEPRTWRCDPKSTTCSCLRRQQEYLTSYFKPGFAYDKKGRLRTPGVPIFECNSLCACDDDECKNRVVQHGRKCHVAKKTVNKGWGVFATKHICKGSFIGVYSGEFLRDEVSEMRGLVYDKLGRTYLLNLDPYYLEEGEYVIDAYHAGNNNSCDPNCMVNPCYIDEPDIVRPLMVLFAVRNISIGEELCFSYEGYVSSCSEDPAGAEVCVFHSLRVVT